MSIRPLPWLAVLTPTIEALENYARTIDGALPGQREAAKAANDTAAMLGYGLGPDGLYPDARAALRGQLREQLIDLGFARKACRAYDREGRPRPAYHARYRPGVLGIALVLRKALRDLRASARSMQSVSA